MVMLKRKEKEKGNIKASRSNISKYNCEEKVEG